jgi:hypothetical protein
MAQSFFLICRAHAQSAIDLPFRYGPQLSGFTPSLSVSIKSVDAKNGAVQLNGNDNRRPSSPFTINWGDGETSTANFPAAHQYQNPKANYVVSVTAHYSKTKNDTAHAIVRFAAPSITPITLPRYTNVSIPRNRINLGTRLYEPPADLRPFSDSVFKTSTRNSVEYVMSVAAHAQMDLVNNDVYLPNGSFRQKIFFSPSAGGAFSIWYSNPPSVGAGQFVFGATVQYSSLFHEMGHNFTLNTPSKFMYGGRIDGNANAIYSETLAQIIAHVTAAELVTRYQEFGFSDDLALEIAFSAQDSMRLIRSSYANYIAAGKKFVSWNNPATPVDETFNTFMTIAYKFFEIAERQNASYTEAFKRMMALLQVFDADSHTLFGQHENTRLASIFRSTLFVTALSHAFDTDLRQEFRSLGFPVNDAMYDDLMAKKNSRRNNAGNH